MSYITAFFCATLITLVLMPGAMRWAVRLGVVDIPSPRKVHSQAVPKCGGIVMAAGMIVTALIWIPIDDFMRSLLAGALIVAIFGFWDDARELGYKAKFFGQVTAALLVILWGGVEIRCLGDMAPDGFLLPSWISIPLTLVVIVGVTNAINLSDGLDGLAGGISLLSFLGMGSIAYLSGNTGLAMTGAIVVGAIFGFLRFNTHPATVFMGDAGSQLLGFLAITLCLELTQCNTALNALLPLFILGFPVLDTLTVMIRRISEGRNPFVADKNHLHHRIMRLGFLHGEAVIAVYALQFFFVAMALALRFYSEWVLFFIYLAASGLVIGTVSWAGRFSWQIDSQGFLRIAVTGRLKKLWRNPNLARISYGAVEAYALFLLFFTSILPSRVFFDFGCIALLLAVVLVVGRFLKQEVFAKIVRAVVYLMIPLAVYLSQTQLPLWFGHLARQAYTFSFGGLVLLVALALTQDLTKRRFSPTPMDFLILFIAVAAPFFPDKAPSGQNMGLLAAKIIVMFFSFEFLFSHLGKRVGRVAAVTMAALLIVGLKGVL